MEVGPTTEDHQWFKTQWFISVTKIRNVLLLQLFIFLIWNKIKTTFFSCFIEFNNLCYKDKCMYLLLTPTTIIV